jgi:hypothetical protein
MRNPHLLLCALVFVCSLSVPAQSQTPQQRPTPQPNAVLPSSEKTAPTPATVEPASTKIAPGSKVYITPMDGFENYLLAALGKKKVALFPVADKERADYIIAGTSLDKKAGWAKIVFMGNLHSDNAASITMTDVKTGAIVYAYAVDKKSTMHGQQTTAEACAKHLKGHMDGKE